MLNIRFRANKFVILFVGRTGSTYLQEMLDSHPQIRALGEGLAELKNNGAHQQLKWVEWALTPPILGRYRAVGFKTKLVDILDPQGFALILKKQRVKIIHMQRRNRIKSVISYFNAKRLWEHTEQWNLYSGYDRLPAFSINLEKFNEALINREKVEIELNEFVKMLSLPVLPIFYEDLLTQKNNVLSNINSFLGVETKQVISQTKKATSDNLKAAVENFNELRSHFIGTSYESMFDEVLFEE
jgi:LPS sulfotransferase NodH